MVKTDQNNTKSLDNRESVAAAAGQERMAGSSHDDETNKMVDEATSMILQIAKRMVDRKG